MALTKQQLIWRVSDLRAELKRSKITNNDLQSRIVGLEREQVILTSELADLEDAVEEQQNFEGKCVSAGELVHDLESVVEELQLAIGAKTEEMDEIVSEYNTEICALEEENESFEKKNSYLEEVVSSLESDRDENNLNDSSDDIACLEARISELEDELNQSYSDNRVLENDNVEGHVVISAISDIIASRTCNDEKPTKGKKTSKKRPATKARLGGPGRTK